MLSRVAIAAVLALLLPANLAFADDFLARFYFSANRAGGAKGVVQNHQIVWVAAQQQNAPVFLNITVDSTDTSEDAVYIVDFEDLNNAADHFCNYRAEVEIRRLPSFSIKCKIPTETAYGGKRCSSSITTNPGLGCDFYFTVSD